MIRTAVRQVAKLHGMPEIDLFGFYRHLLSLLVGIYATVRLIVFIWNCPFFNPGPGHGAAVANRYLGVLLLRIRVRLFLFDMAVIASLTFVLGLLIHRHWQ